MKYLISDTRTKSKYILHGQYFAQVLNALSNEIPNHCNLNQLHINPAVCIVLLYEPKQIHSDFRAVYICQYTYNEYVIYTICTVSIPGKFLYMYHTWTEIMPKYIYAFKYQTVIDQYYI